MSDEKPAGNNPANQGNSNANKDSGKSNRRRSSRNRRRGRRPEESSTTRESRTQSSAPKAAEAEKSVRDNRDRRRRRRMRSKQRGQSETPAPVAEHVLKDLPPLVPAFVYTHVLRPSMRDSFEFRTEHFSKVTRKMEDFHIDLSPLYPEGGDEIKGVGYVPPGEREEFDDTDDDADDESYEDLDWDSEESGDAARLEGAIADEFYDDLGDTVDEAAPEDDPDAEEGDSSSKTRRNDSM